MDRKVSTTHSQYTFDYNVGYEYRSETRILLTGTNVAALIRIEHPGAHIHKIHWDGCAWADQEPQPGPVMHPPTFPIDPEYARRYSAWCARRRAQGLPVR
jgi:hypothetical protein